MISGIVAAQTQAGATGTIWDAAAKGSSVVLSNGNLDALNASSSWQSVMGTVGKASGKWQFECLIVASGGNQGIGLADRSNTTAACNTYLGSGSGVVETIGFLITYLYRKLTSGASFHSHGLSHTTGDIITVTLDLTGAIPAATWYKNGVLADSNTANMPAGKTWYPACSVQNSGKLRLVPTGLTYPQIGFSDWG